MTDLRQFRLQRLTQHIQSELQAKTRNSAVADKTRDTFVQMQWHG